MGGKQGKFIGPFLFLDKVHFTFIKLKEKFSSTPMLRHFNSEKCYDQEEAAGYLYPQRSPTLRQGYQVRVTTCRDHVIYDHMIYATQGHVTFKPGEPTGGMARRACILSQVSQQV